MYIKCIKTSHPATNRQRRQTIEPISGDFMENMYHAILIPRELHGNRDELFPV